MGWTIYDSQDVDGELISYHGIFPSAQKRDLIELRGHIKRFERELLLASAGLDRVTYHAMIDYYERIIHLSEKLSGGQKINGLISRIGQVLDKNTEYQVFRPFSGLADVN